MKIIFNPSGYPQVFEFPDYGTRAMIIPIIVVENGSKTNGSYNWENQLLHLEDGRIFRPDYESGSFVLVHTNYQSNSEPMADGLKL